MRLSPLLRQRVRELALPGPLARLDRREERSRHRHQPHDAQPVEEGDGPLPLVRPRTGGDGGIVAHLRGEGSGEREGGREGGGGCEVLLLYVDWVALHSG